MKKHKWTDKETAQLTGFKANGIPDSTIANMMGLPFRTITTRLHTLRKRGAVLNTAPVQAEKAQEPEPKDAAFWRQEAQRLSRDLEKARRKENATEVLVAEVQSIAPKSYTAAPAILAHKSKPHGSPQSAVLMFSDTHIGQVVTPDQTLGMGGYNFDIFLRRLARLEHSVFSILRDHTTTAVPEIVVAMLGDMIHGALVHSVEAGQVNTLFSQFYAAGHALAQFFRNLSTIAPLRVHTAVGNHCVDSDTELLTNAGWKRIESISGSEQCLGVDRTGRAKWQPFQVVKEVQVDRMVHIENRMFDFRGTEHHRFYFRPTGCGGLFEGRWSDIAPLVRRDAIEIPTAVELPGDGDGVPDSLIELAAAVLTDGCLSGKRVAVYQHAKKEAWVREAFEKSGLLFSRFERTRKRPLAICGRSLKAGGPSVEVTYYLHADASREFMQRTGIRAKNILPGWAKHLTKPQFDRFLMALINGDGTCSHPHSWVLYGKSKEWLDSVQALMLCYGYSGQVSAYCPNNTNPNTQYRLTIRKSSWLSIGAGARIDYTESTGEQVWCVMTDTENFFCRRNGRAYLTGNTRWQNQHRMPTDNRFSNLDQFLYAYVQALLSDVPAITINLTKQPFSRFEVQGWNFLAGHGDHLRGGDKNLGIPNHAIGRNVQVHSQLAFRAGEPLPNYFLVGHLHRPITLPTTMGEFIVNGGFPGLDGFALMEAFNSAHPSQKFFLVHPQFGRSATYDLRLDLGDKTPHHYTLPEEFLCR